MERPPRWALELRLNLNDTPLEPQIKLQYAAMTEDPWSNPHLQLTVSARRIEGYELEGKTNRGDQQFTLPLPDLEGSSLNPEADQVTLVTYGCTHLCVTIFPLLKRS